MLDGINILDCDMDKFGVVNQEPVVFSGTVGYNLQINRDIQDDDLHYICEKYLCDHSSAKSQEDFSIKDKINEILEKDVGPKGSKLSGGEKQRLACARAMIRKP